MRLVNAARRLINYLRHQRRVNALGTQPSWQRVPAGFWMRIDPRAQMDIEYFLGTYERALRRLVDLLVAPGDAVVDAGTHKGYVTLALARAVGPTGVVVSVDPDPRAFMEMDANCTRNGFAQVRRFQLAAGDVDGSCSFTLTTSLGNSSRFPNEVALAGAAEVVTVRTRPVDALLDETGVLAGDRPLTFVKIDAEGSEPLVLGGMQEAIARHRPAIYSEINPSSLAQAGVSTEWVLTMLRSHGYELFRSEWRRTILGGRLRLTPVEGMADPSVLCFEILAISPRHRAWPAVQRLLA